jgi:hypothetical protein
MKSKWKKAAGIRRPATDGQSDAGSPPEVQGCPIVGVGASAGGLEALTRLLKHLPSTTGLGFVFVQHLDPQHESALTHILARATTMPVREVTHQVRKDARRDSRMGGDVGKPDQTEQDKASRFQHSAMLAEPATSRSEKIR